MLSGSLTLLALWTARAEAQARVDVVGWTDGGEAVLRITDPMVDYRTETWAAGAPESFTAICTPASPTADEETCRLCADDTACPSKPGKKKGKIAVKPKRKCTGPKRAPTACDLSIKLGRAGTVTHALWAPKLKAVVDPSFRPDGKAVVLLITNETASGDVYDTFMVLDLARR